MCSGLGIAPNKIRDVIGIAKAYCTRVGSGPFPTELLDETGEKLRKVGMEFGATTGRPRRCGWIDIPQLLYTVMLNGVTQVIITKLDVLDAFEKINVAESYQYDNMITEELPFDIVDKQIDPKYVTFDGWFENLGHVNKYEDLPVKANQYIQKLELMLRTRISMVSTGPEREKLFAR